MDTNLLSLVLQIVQLKVSLGVLYCSIKMLPNKTHL